MMPPAQNRAVHAAMGPRGMRPPMAPGASPAMRPPAPIVPPPTPYLGRVPAMPGMMPPRMAAGGAVQAPQSYYAQGGEVDVSQSMRPVMPATPSMQSPGAVGYADGGNVLSADDRAELPTSDFAVPSKAPGSGSYPMPDRAHAANAKARASQFGSPAVKRAVAAKAKAKFGMAKGGVVPRPGQPAVGTDQQERKGPEAVTVKEGGKSARRARVERFEEQHGDDEI